MTALDNARKNLDRYARRARTVVEAGIERLPRRNGAAADEPTKPGTVMTPFGPMEPVPFPEGPARAMVIMAHPDDAEFVCGGTIAKWCAEGWDVTYVVVTGGDKGTHDPEMYPEKLAAIREEEQRAACRALGVRECILLGYPDGFTIDDAELRGHLVRLIRMYRPDVVITWDAFHRGFNHRDHRNIGTLTADAVYPLIRDRLFYEQDEADGLPAHEVNEILLAGSDAPDFTVDVTDHWETRLEAVLCHISQIGGRTREDYLKFRDEQVKRQGHNRIEERYRRWSLANRSRRRPDDDEKEDRMAAEGTKEPATAS